MKIDKEKEKKINNSIKIEAKKRKYKLRQDIVFFVKEKYFIYCIVYLDNKNEINYSINIKELAYDDIFWKVMNMEENCDEPLSLRAIGAFKSYPVVICNDKFIYEDDVDKIAKGILDNMEIMTKEFIKANDLDEYILNEYNGYDKDFLSCIVYLKKGRFSMAKNIAKKNIENGQSGGFRNEGKTFFEYVLNVDENTFLN